MTTRTAPVATDVSSMRHRSSARVRYHTLHTSQSRAFLEGYWQSVLRSSREPPLYHTFSDRYGGTQGIPYATRSPAGRTFSTRDEQTRGLRSIEGCIADADEAMLTSDLAHAERRLKEALTHLQNHDGGLSLAALATTTAQATPSELVRTRHTAEILLRLGKIALLRAAHMEALQLLDLSGEANPLALEVYALKAACYERMGRPREAYAEYTKYLKLHEPSMEVLAHCGKCAAEADLFDEAEHHLHALLQCACIDAESCEDAEAAFARAFYAAHADFYLGYLYERQAKRLVSPTTKPDSTGSGAVEMAHGAGLAADFDALRERAATHFRRAVGNACFVQAYEDAVGEAVTAHDFRLARELLGYLQRMRPSSAAYSLRTADVCRMAGDVDGELLALSGALDCHQSTAARRRTLLARGVVYAELVHDLDRAITDYSLVLDATPNSATCDECGAVAHLKRAEAYRRRQTRVKSLAGSTTPVSGREDEVAALRDYNAFLCAIDAWPAIQDAGEATEPVGAGDDRKDGRVDDEVEMKTQYRSQECYACLHDVQKTIEVMLILAHGAFERGDYGAATHFFARAIARGWLPSSTMTGARSYVCGVTTPVDHTTDEMFIALAHHVMQEQPVSEEMFRVAYEQREWVIPPDSRRSRVMEKREAERTLIASPSLAYVVVDARYCALRALEPTMFSRLECAFIDLWEGYRGEVERNREDAVGTRGGRRTKRYGQT